MAYSVKDPQGAHVKTCAWDLRPLIVQKQITAGSSSCFKDFLAVGAYVAWLGRKGSSLLKPSLSSTCGFLIDAVH